MASENPSTSFEEASPRSTVLPVRMASVLPSMMNEGSTADPLEKIPTPEKATEEEPKSPKKEEKDNGGVPAKENDRMTPTTPLPHEYYTHVPPYPTLTPQPSYFRYGQTPEPASPAFTDFFPSPFVAPLSPSRTFMTTVPPGSPLIPPRTEKPYNNSFYPAISSTGSEELWNQATESRPPGYMSPQLPYGVPLGGRSRAYSMEESMLPPAVLDSPYSPYQETPIYHQPPAWSYGGPPDIYSASGSPLQPRTAMYSMPRGMYYPATSPGPPIQMAGHNKGPDGANLFIFHIPNHFTNQDMYRLFEPYGTLLSVRIMVEKDSGRSRGFGFVSYDSPDAAAVAIQKLNGFQLGNKRLKVQHKQIRREQQNHHHPVDDQQHYGFNANLPPTAPAGWLDPPVTTAPPPPLTTATAAAVVKETSSPKQNNPLDSLTGLSEALPDVPGKEQVNGK